MIELFQSSPAALTAVAVLLGLLVGSFLNVVIHRMPQVLSREWRAQAVDVIFEWAQENEAPEVLRKAGSGLANVRQSLAAAPRYNLVIPRSACPQCASSALENIPVLAGSGCVGAAPVAGHPSGRYLVVEAITGVISGCVAWPSASTWPL
jgi:leader peptidase (prepilin peptidase)/N-methyltransferase